MTAIRHHLETFQSRCLWTSFDVPGILKWPDEKFNEYRRRVEGRATLLFYLRRFSGTLHI